MRGSPTFAMKSKRTLTIALASSLFVAEALIGADAPKKPASTTAQKAPKGASEKPAQEKKAPAAKAVEAKPADAKPSAAPVADGVPDVVAVVEGVEVKRAELDAALEGILAQQGRSSADMPAEQKPMFYRMVLDDVIIDKLITKRSAGVKLAEGEVDALVDKLKKNFGSEEEFAAQIKQMGQTLDAVKENISSNLRQQHWVEEQIKGKDEVTDADAETFYKANPDQFKQPEQVRASHILIMVPEDAKPEVVIEKEKAAQAVLKRVKGGEAFDKVADEVSEDPSAKQNHGDLDFFSKDRMVPEFADAAFKMKEGEVSAEPVRSQYGYHVIKVTGRKAPETIALETVKPQVLAYLKNEKKKQEVEKIVREIRAKADVKINLPEVKMPALGAPAGAAPAAPAAPAEPAAPAAK